jgi:glucose-6-phosphate isomerase
MLDWSNLKVRDSGDVESWSSSWAKLKARFDQGEVGFYHAVVSDEISQAKESEFLASKILTSGRFTDCLYLGIGGSALGPISLIEALPERRQNALRFHFLENPDPLDWNSTLACLRPESTLLCIVAKSGTTFETLAQTLLALEWLGTDRLKTHVVAITDPKKGDLKKFASDFQIPTLYIDPSIGGRFSIFSPVGLFTTALAGLSVNEFLSGARQARDYMEKTATEKNAVFLIAQELIKNFSKRPIHVCMPYSTRLRAIGAWFAQLWGESLGKEGKGFTPVAAVGATDQHSILQLLRDGPDDKVTLFITISEVENEIAIPRTRISAAYPAFQLLEGHSLHELLKVEYQATSRVLTNQGRPNLTLQLDRLDERNLGALYFFLSVLTGFTGTYWELNPFDQPGVEEGKVYIRDALSRGAQNSSSSP